MYLPWTYFAQTQEVPDKGFLCHIFTQVQNDIHSIFLILAKSQKMHLNFGTCPQRQETDPNGNWGRPTIFQIKCSFAYMLIC